MYKCFISFIKIEGKSDVDMKNRNINVVEKLFRKSGTGLAFKKIV